MNLIDLTFKLPRDYFFVFQFKLIQLNKLKKYLRKKYLECNKQILKHIFLFLTEA